MIILTKQKNKLKIAKGLNNQIIYNKLDYYLQKYMIKKNKYAKCLIKCNQEIS